LMNTKRMGSYGPTVSAAEVAGYDFRTGQEIRAWCLETKEKNLALAARGMAQTLRTFQEGDGTGLVLPCTLPVPHTYAHQISKD